VMLEIGDVILETGDLILATGGFLRQLILQSLHPLLHVVSLLKEFPARLIPIGGPPTSLSVICTREGASQHGLGEVSNDTKRKKQFLTFAWGTGGVGIGVCSIELDGRGAKLTS